MQACGEAEYVDDIPSVSNELFGSFVLSTVAHARIKSIDTSAALALPNIHSFVSAKDVPGSNAIGPVVRDDEVFASETVQCIGYPIGLILATNRVRSCVLK